MSVLNTANAVMQRNEIKLKKKKNIICVLNAQNIKKVKTAYWPQHSRCFCCYVSFFKKKKRKRQKKLWNISSVHHILFRFLFWLSKNWMTLPIEDHIWASDLLEHRTFRTCSFIIMLSVTTTTTMLTNGNTTHTKKKLCTKFLLYEQRHKTTNYNVGANEQKKSCTFRFIFCFWLKSKSFIGKPNNSSSHVVMWMLEGKCHKLSQNQFSNTEAIKSDSIEQMEFHHHQIIKLIMNSQRKKKSTTKN